MAQVLINKPHQYSHKILMMVVLWSQTTYYKYHLTNWHLGQMLHCMMAVVWVTLRSEVDSICQIINTDSEYWYIMYGESEFSEEITAAIAHLPSIPAPVTKD